MKISIKSYSYILLLLGLGLSACKIGPDFKSPNLATPRRWGEPLAAGMQTAPAELRTWWRQFRDPALDRLIGRAAAGNLDLKIALERVAEARAARGAAQAGLLPSINASTGVTKLRGGFAQGLSGVGPPATAPGQGTRSPVIAPFETDIYQFGFDAAWEIDIFGGQRRKLEAATAQVQAAEEGRRDALVTVLAEVGRNYLELRGTQQRLAIVKRNIDAQRDTVHLTQVRYNAGLASDLDVARASAQVAGTEAQVPPLERAISLALHRLAVLLGQPPDALRQELMAPAALPAVPGQVPIGQPPELLARRPDIRRAEADLAAATARLGAARADQYPKLSLTGVVGRQATDIPDLRLAAGNFFSIGPSLRLPILAGGRIRANIAAEDARLKQAEHGYEQTVLKALEDVENALAGFGREQERRAKLERAVKEHRYAEQLARELYLRGLSDFIAVLDAQRERFEAEDNLAASETAVGVNLVGLYKALGGGWI